MNKDELEDRFIGELVSNFMSGEVPLNWDEIYIKEDFPRAAYRAAENLNRRLSHQDKQHFIEFLDEISKNDQHEFFEKLMYEETIAWSGDDKSWEMFQALAKYLIDFFITDQPSNPGS